MSNLNLDFYDGNSLYIYSYLRNLDENVINLLKTTKDFYSLEDKIPLDILYFSPPAKVYTISSLNLDKEDEVLEVNATFGCVTQFLCDRVKHVTAVEFAKSNADILYERLKDRDNLEIFVGNISKMKFDRKFDKIILTDVLEFASFFFKSINPYREFMNFFKNLLKPDGEIVLQIFNKFGVKNFVGEKDEYTGKRFEGLMDYPKFSLRSFGKKELEKLFNEIGFGYVKFYYPAPIHYSPKEILSDEAMNNYCDLIYESKMIDNIFADIRKRNEFEFFSNSYMIVAKIDETPPAKEFLYSKFINVKVNTSLIYDREKDIKYYQKTPLCERSKVYLQKMYDYYFPETERLKNLGIDNVWLCPCRKEGDSIIFDYVPGKTLEDLFIEDFGEKPLESINCYKDLIIKYRDFIYRLYPETEIRDFHSKDVWPEFEDYVFKNMQCAKNVNLDLNMSNIIANGDKYTIIDYDSICPDYFPIKLLFFTLIALRFFYYGTEFADLMLEVLDISKEEYNQFVKIVISKKDMRCDMRDIVLKEYDLE